MISMIVSKITGAEKNNISLRFTLNTMVRDRFFQDFFTLKIMITLLRRKQDGGRGWQRDSSGRPRTSKQGETSLILT